MENTTPDLHLDHGVEEEQEQVKEVQKDIKEREGDTSLSSSLPKFILKSFDRKMKQRYNPKVPKPAVFLRSRYTKIPSTGAGSGSVSGSGSGSVPGSDEDSQSHTFSRRESFSLRSLRRGSLSLAAQRYLAPVSERGMTAGNAEYLRLYYPVAGGGGHELPRGQGGTQQEGESGSGNGSGNRNKMKDKMKTERENAISDKIERVRNAGFAGPASVSRRNFHSSVEYKPEVLADKARLLRTLTRNENELSKGQRGIYRSMRNVSHMVVVSKQLTEDISTMDHVMRVRLNAMFHDQGDHIEKLFQPGRPPRRKMKEELSTSLGTSSSQMGSTGSSGSRSKSGKRGGGHPRGNTRAFLGRSNPSFLASQPPFNSNSSALVKNTETKGSGFRKKRSHMPHPRWIDHRRLLQRAQFIADLEWNAYMNKNTRGQKPAEEGGGGGARAATEMAGDLAFNLPGEFRVPSTA